MNAILKYIFPNFIWSFFLTIVWSNLLEKKINFKSKKYYIQLILLMIISLITYLTVEKLIRIVLITVIFMFMIRIFYSESIKKSIITPIYYQLIMFTSEFVCIIILTFVFNFKNDFLLNNFYGLLITNLLISLIAFTISKIPFIITIYKKINKLIENLTINSLTILCLILIIILNLIDIMVYYKISVHTLMFINFFIISICVFIIFNNIITHSKYNKVYDKYNIVINSLNSYEEMMKKYRVLNHENKNTLLTIRSMVVNNESDISEYIDSIVNTKINDDEQLLFKMAVIPSGGLRATFYSKILKICDNNIKYNLDIDNNVSSLNFLSIDKKTIIDICNIFSVFIDNAIDETLNYKNKRIDIDMHSQNNEIVINVGNYINKSVDVVKIYKEGFSTKGEGRGYGLSLVEKIINENPLLKNEISIQKNYFIQSLIIKIN